MANMRNRLNSYDLWINESPTYFEWWETWRNTSNYFYLIKQENQKNLATKYQAEAFNLLKNQFGSKKKKFNEKVEQINRQDNKVINTTLGGSTLDNGYDQTRKKGKGLLSKLKEKIFKTKEVEEKVNGSGIYTQAQIKSMMNEMDNVELDSEPNTLNKITSTALSTMGKPIADRLAKKEMDKLISALNGPDIEVNLTQEQNGNRRIRDRISSYILELFDTDKSLNVDLSYDNYTQNKKKSQTKNLILHGSANMGYLENLVENPLFDPNMDNYKRATIYNTAHSNGSFGNFYAEYKNMKDALKVTYVDEALKKVFPEMTDGIIMINGELINLYSILYYQGVSSGKRIINMETELPPGHMVTPRGRRSYSMIKMYKKYKAKINIDIKI